MVEIIPFDKNQLKVQLKELQYLIDGIGTLESFELVNVIFGRFGISPENDPNIMLNDNGDYEIIGDTDIYSMNQNAIMYHIMKLSQSSHNLSAFTQYKRIAVSRLHRNYVSLLSTGELVPAFTLLRNLFEHVGQYYLAVTEIEEAFETEEEYTFGLSSESIHAHTPPDVNRKLVIWMKIDRILQKRFYATRIDWERLFEQGIKARTANQFKYRQKSAHHVDNEAGNLLKGIDKLNQTNSGIRLAYDFLCEFTHPNIGNIYSMVQTRQTGIDVQNVEYEILEIGEGYPESSVVVLTNLITDTLHRYKESLILFKQSIDKMRLIEKEHHKIVQIAMRRFFRYLPSHVNKNWDCPCGSGKNARKCCAKPRYRS